MPFLSLKQSRFAHANPEKFGGAKGLREWDKATDFSSLPEKKDPPMDKPRKMWLRGDAHHEGAIKHPGALKAAAARHGLSTLQEAEKEKKSSNPHIRGRGALGVRLIKKQI
jgi:hypothetical protein